MNSVEEFEFWVGEFLEKPQSLEHETWRIFSDLHAKGNVHAVVYYEKMQRDARRKAIERGEVVEPDAPLNSFGNIDEKEVDLSIVPRNPDADYPNDWYEIARARKKSRDWKCEVCLFQKIESGLIQVHHIDQDKSNNEKLNLQVLCAVCHGKKHWSPPLYPPGVPDRDISELRAYHLSNRRPSIHCRSNPK